MSDRTESRLEVWIDGNCPVCRRSERWCRKRDHSGRLAFKDLRRDPDPPAPRDRLEQAVHVRLPDGSVVAGFEAWRRILLELREWRWLGRTTALPGLWHVGSLMYRLVAANRRHFPAGGS
jgi:predicted DCC family thiol-disulfide oxidoreductase YuxK